MAKKKPQGIIHNKPNGKKQHWGKKYLEEVLFSLFSPAPSGAKQGSEHIPCFLNSKIFMEWGQEKRAGNYKQQIWAGEKNIPPPSFARATQTSGTAPHRVGRGRIPWKSWAGALEWFFLVLGKQQLAGSRWSRGHLSLFDSPQHGWDGDEGGIQEEDLGWKQGILVFSPRTLTLHLILWNLIPNK